MGVWYTTREDVKDSLEISYTARADRKIDRRIEAASRDVEALLHRRFYPELRTLRVDWPNYQFANTWEYWLGDNEMISTTQVVNGAGTDITASVILRRGDDRVEPPYTRLEVDLSTTATLAGGSTFQRALQITGLFGGCPDTNNPAGQLAAGINDSVTVFTINPLNGVLDVGVGSIIKIDSERMLVTERRMVDTGQNLQSNMDDLQSDNVVDVTDGTAFAINEILLLDAERMRIVDIAGNNLTVERAFDGTVLGVHTVPVDVYALRSYSVTRAALGTTAATHDISDVVSVFDVPGPVRELCTAIAVVLLEQNASAYARVVGTGNATRESSGQGLQDIIAAAKRSHGRLSRLGAI